LRSFPHTQQVQSSAVKLVMTLLVRDEADIVDAQIAYHLNAGVDFVIAMDNGSQDGTLDVFDSYARAGYLHLLHEAGNDFRQAEWVTRMARLAATEFGADWVLNTDADEFWWPRQGTFKEILSEVPARFGMVRALLRNFPPRPDEGGWFLDRMVARVAPRELELHSPMRIQDKVLHRADPAISVTTGNHEAYADGLADLRGWYPVEILHFPVRSVDQFIRKLSAYWAALTKQSHHDPLAHLYPGYDALREGRVDEYYASLAVDDEALERGVEDGSLVIDTRVRDALESRRRRDGAEGATSEFLLPPDGPPPLQFPPPTLVEQAAFAAEVTIGAERDSIVKVERRLGDAARRLTELERGVWSRVRSGTHRRIGSRA